MGKGNLYDEASRSHAPDDIADIHFDDADSVSPTEIAFWSARPDRKSERDVPFRILSS